MNQTTSKLQSSDFAFAQNSAYRVLTTSNSAELPIKIKQLIRSYGIYIQTYTQFAKDCHLTIQDIIFMCASEDGCTIKRSDGTYLLLYNDLIKSKGRIRYTLAHELGHYILKHHSKSNIAKISRGNFLNNLDKKNYDLLEKEANYFAKRLLVPLPILNKITNKLNFINTPLLTSIFGISQQPANYIINELSQRKIIYNYPELHQLNLKFQNFIKNHFNNKFCLNCHYNYSINSNFCPICGQTPFLIPDLKNTALSNILRKKNSMNYHTLNLDSEGRIQDLCPICQNEKLYGNYCQICGIDIINKCTGIKYSHGGILTNCPPCSTPLKGDARYCTECGANSTFLENGLLKNWQEDLEHPNN
ncbi:MAG: ImmA/IrrE family metallo-endopeptidase [Lactococcus lactis]|nr:ImmA/IrrE family metallo-endopeptidase [Lactococcus lactis]